MEQSQKLSYYCHFHFNKFFQSFYGFSIRYFIKRVPIQINYTLISLELLPVFLVA